MAQTSKVGDYTVFVGKATTKDGFLSLWDWINDNGGLGEIDASLRKGTMGKRLKTKFFAAAAAGDEESFEGIQKALKKRTESLREEAEDDAGSEVSDGDESEDEDYEEMMKIMEELHMDARPTTNIVRKGQTSLSGTWYKDQVPRAQVTLVQEMRKLIVFVLLGTGMPIEDIEAMSNYKLARAAGGSVRERDTARKSLVLMGIFLVKNGEAGKYDKDWENNGAQWLGFGCIASAYGLILAFTASGKSFKDSATSSERTHNMRGVIGTSFMSIFLDESSKDDRTTAGGKTKVEATFFKLVDKFLIPCADVPSVLLADAGGSIEDQKRFEKKDKTKRFGCPLTMASKQFTLMYGTMSNADVFSALDFMFDGTAAKKTIGTSLFEFNSSGRTYEVTSVAFGMADVSDLDSVFGDPSFFVKLLAGGKHSQAEAMEIAGCGPLCLSAYVIGAELPKLRIMAQLGDGSWITTASRANHEYIREMGVEVRSATSGQMVNLVKVCFEDMVKKVTKTVALLAKFESMISSSIEEGIKTSGYKEIKFWADPNWEVVTRVARD